MQKFSKLPYERPNLQDVQSQFESLINEIKSADSAEKTIELINQINELRGNFDTMSSLASVRYAANTSDSKYEKERDFFDQNQPDYSMNVMEFYKAVLESPFINDVEAHFGSHYIKLLSLKVKTFSIDVIDLLREENQLTTQYVKLMSGVSVEFEGQTYNLSGMVPMMQSTDRETRKKSSEAYYAALYNQREELDEIYTNLVEKRSAIAKGLGYNNFVDLAYDRMRRYDYNIEDVRAFRKLVEKHVVPLVTEFKEQQAKRIGLDKLKHFDESFKFKTGNPTPKGSPDWILKNGQKMYKELSSETDVFFSEMVQGEMMDLVNRNNKQGGGFCTYFPKFRSPFIFSNFNGTSHDIDVLTHEAGHAFQIYCSKDQPVNEYWWPTMEAAEIHSMSMEFLTWPWMNLYFNGDTQKYYYDHILSSLIFLPYSCAIDEFQETAYLNPNDSVSDRLARWDTVEKKYQPHKDNDGVPFLEEARFWQRQGHVYRSPFYYIDYALAQVCAFQFWMKSKQDFQSTWGDYLRLCKAGGSKPFLGLIDEAGIKSPFEEETILEVIEALKKWLSEQNMEGY